MRLISRRSAGRASAVMPSIIHAIAERLPIRLIRSVKHRLDWIVINPGGNNADTAAQKLSRAP